MTLILQNFASGDTDYIAKLNSNNDAIEAAVNAVQTLQAVANTGQLTVINMLLGLLGGGAAILGTGALSASIVGTTVVLTSGYVWKGPEQQILLSGGGTLDFTGRSAGLYYIDTDSNGTVQIVTSSTEALWRVNWNGAALSNLLRVAPVFFSATDDTNALTSNTASPAETYTDLDARLEAIEAGGSGGGLNGVLIKSADYTALGGDNGKLLVFQTASPPATLTLPATAPSSTWAIFVQNIGTSDLTIDRNGRTLDGASSDLTLTTGQGVVIFTDGTNYYTERGIGGAGETSGIDLDGGYSNTIYGGVTPLDCGGAS